VMNPETYVGKFGLSCIFWSISDNCLVQWGVTDGGIQVLHVLLAFVSPLTATGTDCQQDLQ